MSETVTYEGERLFDGPKVWCVDADGIRKLLRRTVRFHVVGDGWVEWGYGGSGPAELALNLLADALGADALCERCKGTGRRRGSPCGECRGSKITDPLWRAHQDFKWVFIAGLPDQRWSLDAADIREWWSSVSVQEAMPL